jgi:hypothetical protein
MPHPPATYLLRSCPQVADIARDTLRARSWLARAQRRRRRPRQLYPWHLKFGGRWSAFAGFRLLDPQVRKLKMAVPIV